MSRIPISHKNRIRGEERHRKRADLNLSANNAADLLALEETLTAVDVILADAIQTVSDDLDIVELAVIDIESDSAALTTRVDIAETDRTTIVPQIGGGVLVALRENEIYDGGTYTLPLANSVLENQTIIITLPDEFRDFTPIVSVTGSDAIFYSGRSTTASVGGYSILFDAKKLQSITLTSDGNAVWGL